jgi:hypothetical protein
VNRVAEAKGGLRGFCLSGFQGLENFPPFFQALEKFSRDCPMLGKTGADVSKAWKAAPLWCKQGRALSPV